jgi:hypothetical protein
MKRLLLGSVALVALIAGSVGISSGAFAQSPDTKSLEALETENAALRARISRLEAEKQNAALRTRVRQLEAEGPSVAAQPVPATRYDPSIVRARPTAAPARGFAAVATVTPVYKATPVVKSGNWYVWGDGE